MNAEIRALVTNYWDFKHVHLLSSNIPQNSSILPISLRNNRKSGKLSNYPFRTEYLNGLTAKSPGIQSNERLCLTACAHAEVGWGKESGCGIGVMNVTDAKRKRQPKEKQSFS